MNSATEWTRRSVLKCIVWVGAAAALRPLASALGKASTRYPAVDPRTIFGEIKSAAVLGRAYLELHPEERSIARLHELIWSECTERELERARTGRAALQQVIGGRQRCDFERGQTVMLDGWVLARTEARLYALAAL